MLRSRSLGIKAIAFALFTLLGIVGLFSCNAFPIKPQSHDYYKVVAADSHNDRDSYWTDYLCKHLGNRSSQGSLVVDKDPEHKHKVLDIVLGTNPSASFDYNIHFSGDKVFLTAHDDEKMIWLLYQFMEMLGDVDRRFDVSDLPPSMFAFWKDVSGKFAFEYRSIYSPTNNDPDKFQIVAAGNVDYDWALWGHNLSQVLPEDVDESVYSSVNGNYNHDQFCFSSDILYKALENYVTKTESAAAEKNGVARFVIMPNDNDIVCRCSECVAAGNTATSATPALTAMVVRLAKEFPNCQFFTSSYLTTEEIPKQKLPSNVGVIVSAIDFPMQYHFEGLPYTQKFASQLKHWAKICSHVYVWDYCCNFDDYMTPYPCLNVLKTRLQFYLQNGVKGIMFNGSGNDYSSFDDVKTYVLSQLLINPDLDVTAATNTFYAKFYPKCGKMISDYYNSIENQVMTTGRVMGFYSGLIAVDSTINEHERFLFFIDKLDAASKKVSGNERTKLNQMLTAFNFTCLEDLSFPGMQKYIERKKIYLENLKGYTSFKNMENYRESNGKMADFIAYMQTHNIYEGPGRGNLLFRRTIKSPTPLDEFSPPLGILTDGLKGTPFDYHANWMIFSRSDSLVLKVPYTGWGERLKIGLLYATPFRIVLPRLRVKQQGRVIYDQLLSPREPGAMFERYVAEIPLRRLKPNVPIQIVLGKVGKKFAIDEVSIY